MAAGAVAYSGGMAGVIVVGVDGSPSSRAALRWAIEEAALRDSRVVAVHAWTFVPPAPLGEPGLMPMPSGDLPRQIEAEEAAAAAELEAALADAFPDGLPDTLEPRLVDGDAADALEAEAREADLLVVGSRGRSGIASVLLGSVSRHVVDHARCPVVVVKPEA
jgi:nucleotide-binding universal stress UspA family protein